METSRKGLRYRVGMFCILLAIISPVVGLVVPLLGLTSPLTTTLVGVLMIGAPAGDIPLGRLTG